MLSLDQIRSRARQWLSPEFNEETREEVTEMLEKDEKKLVDAFYQDLEFGTGGLRGIMGAGTNRMNIYTLGMATQGLSNYLIKTFGDTGIRVAVAHDCRNNSRYFAETAADIFSANGFEVFLFEDLRPTPELSFAIRHYRCNSGVVITASHNPPEYNGYKAYWDDGGQVVPPHDKGVIDEVRKITSVSQIRFDSKKDKIKIIGKETDQLFLDEILKISINPEINRKHSETGIVFTPIHGTGGILVPDALRLYGFSNVHTVPEQDITDGNFPTVKSPNPEEPAALSMAIDKAKKIGAEIVMATDPDADRLGIALRNPQDEFILLNGNQTAVLLIHYILSQYKAKNKYKGNEYIIKTIVTTDLMDKIAESYNVKCYNVLTGFKYFAELIRELEGKEKYIGGGEESYGFLPGDYVRDKDAVASCALFAEMAAFAKENRKTLFDQLTDIYLEYGLYREKLINLVRKGAEGAGEIKAMMAGYRSNPPKVINNSPVVKMNDYSTLVSTNCLTGETGKIDLAKSDVVQFFLQDGSKISVRPSGTEPKIKFYFSVNAPLVSADRLEATEKMLDERISGIIADMKLA
ncbi:MAG: phospho-sugar mutase [Bacteroidales bacterium]|jgi:phosphoglucomutase|nr:phospho-sugar mutase [Bacteroidales bacterium]MDI9552392.1 phospho-sugar mutase [Bacteroidota bacterium]NLK54432.1 phospho-sugar mutase [Bacteroidales bacterium]HPB12949.1 phospho-sugar mutase [Bacteroidales bacterium]HPX43789.1 phospho-sugar mutase [Bacteroidales bacterium]